MGNDTAGVIASPHDQPGCSARSTGLDHHPGTRTPRSIRPKTARRPDQIELAFSQRDAGQGPLQFIGDKFCMGQTLTASNAAVSVG